MKTTLIVMTLFLSLSSFGADARRRAPTRKPAATAVPKPQAKAGDVKTPPRKKEINFEERVLESLNDRGYESLNQTGNIEGGARDRLYRKRADFDEESQYLLREMEYLK